MSEIPELEQALVGAARRHYRRGAVGAATRAHRRFRRPLRAAALVLATLAIAVVGIARIATDPSGERAVATPTATPADDVFARGFAVFRRPRRAADALPKGGALSPHWDVDRSRLVATARGRRIYLVPSSGSKGAPELCMVSTAGGADFRGQCTVLTPAIGDRRLFTSWSTSEAEVVGIFRDGIDKVAVTLRSGDLVHLPVRDNAVLLPMTDNQAVAVSWNDTEGRHHAESLDLPARCPIFEPLPPDAIPQAMRAAMDAQPRLYPQTSEPRVVSAKRMKRGDSLSAPYSNCGADTVHRAVIVQLRMRPRTPSASLSQGTLLLGVVDGRMTVWALLH